MAHQASRIEENVARVRQRIAEAARCSGRDSDDVTLVGVTKYVGVELARLLADCGIRDLGESRPQELWQKAAALGSDVRWHLIGHLQRNKVRRTLPCVSLVQSADSRRLLKSIHATAHELDLPSVPVLIEVNVSGDTAKHGFAPEAVEPLAEALVGWNRLEVRGLMAMASREGDLDDARRDFVQLRELRDQLASLWPEELRLDELSMGMSNDYAVAVEEGATIVRVGSALFEGIEE